MSRLSVVIRYVLPTAICTGLVTFFISNSFQQRSDRRRADETVTSTLYGRCLVAIVERDGVYIGEDRLPIDHFAAVFDTLHRRGDADCALVVGTTKSRYGDAVQVMDKLRRVFGNNVSLQLIAVPTGTRAKAIEDARGWLEIWPGVHR